MLIACMHITLKGFLNNPLKINSSGKNLVLLRQGVEQNEQTTVSHRISSGATPICLLRMTSM